MAEIPSATQSVNLMVASIHSIAKTHRPVEIGIGQVIQAPPELVIAWNGIPIEKEQIYIDQFLLPQYRRLSKGETKLPQVEGTIKMASLPILHTATKSMTITRRTQKANIKQA